MEKPPPSHRFGLLAAVLGVLAGAFPGFAKAAGPRATASQAAGTAPAAPWNSDTSAALPLMAILDPVDLSQVRPVPAAGEILRTTARKAGRFRLLSGEETGAKLREFQWNAGRPCHESQCAFEAGNALVADYVVFGTLTPMKSLSAYSFNVLDVRSGRVVESEVGHALRNSRDSDIESSRAHLAAFAAALDPARYPAKPPAGQGLIAVLDGNPGIPESRVIAERIGTHIHGLRAHDLMGQMELRELVDAMGIPLDSLSASDSGVFALGARLNVACLVLSKLDEEPDGRRLDLTLFDIAGKRRVRSWRSSPSRDFKEILSFETRFFKTLRDWPEVVAAGSGDGKAAGRGGTRWGRAFLGMAGLALAGGFGTLAYASHRKADAAYRRAESSLSPEASAWKRRTETEDRSTLIFGSLAAVALGAGITLWSF